MFKSASTSQFQTAYFGSKTYSGFENLSNQLQSPYMSKKIKKLGVQFNIEENKENKIQEQSTCETQTYKRKEKKNRTFCQYSIISQKQINQKNSLFQDFSGKYIQQNLYLQKFDRKKSNYCDFSSKKNIYEDSTNFDDKKTLSSYQKCKSMKILPDFEQYDQNTQKKLSNKRKQRKFQNTTAFDGLLKQTENLLEKYKKIEDSKTKLKTDLKNQIEIHSKSSKKIAFLEEIEAEKKINKQQKYDYLSRNFTGQKSTEYSSIRKTFSAFDNGETLSPKLRTKDKQNDAMQNEKMFTQTFTQKSQFTSIKNIFGSKKDLNSCSYNGSFGLYKSSSTKRLSPTGLSLQDFQLGKVLGSGAFGEVFPAKHKQTGWIFALKKIKKASVKHMLDQFIQEIKIQLFLDHPNIVKLYSFFDDDLHFYILMEYMEEGSLYSYLKKKKTLTLEETSLKLREVCEGLQHMHENQVLHRDIKPENIVLSHGVSKLCDFGWSAICKDRRTTYCGTLDYVCPEIIEGEGYDDGVDIWSLGVLAFELLVGKTPFYNISRKQTLKKIVDCDLQFPSSVPQVAVNFISNILKKNPQHRQSIDSILKDPLLKISQNQNLSI